MGHLTLTTPILRVICHPYAGTQKAYIVQNLTTLYIFSRSRDMVGAHQNLNGTTNVTMPLSGMFCNPRPSTCYDQPNYQI